jgi:DNA polymerase-1
VKEPLKKFLEDESIGKVAQNGKYDIRIFEHAGIHVRGFNGDPMIASWLLNPARSGHGLDYLTKSFLNEDKIPTGSVVDLKNNQTMADVSIDSVATYACEDAQCTWRLAQLLEAELEQENLIGVYREQELPLVTCLAMMESTGIHVDVNLIKEKEQHLEAYLDQVLAEIRTLAGNDFNPGSPKQVATMLFEKLGLPIIRKTKRGPSTDVTVLEALRHQHELPDLILQFRFLSKLIGTYLRTLPDFINPETNSIHTNFHQIGTETGRLSCDTPNLQNIPKKAQRGREIRAAFTARPNCVLLAADYSQIELRVLAHFSGDETLQHAFREDLDIHRFVAAQVNSVAEDEVTPQMRQAAKAINFGIIYGQSAFGLSQQLGINRKEAQHFIDDYFARFSHVRDYIDSVVEEAEQRGYVETIAGRRRYIPLLKSSNHNERLSGRRTALNSTIQGSAADLIKRAMLRCHEQLPETAHLLIQIHDELIVESPEQCAEQSAQALQQAMIGAWKLNVPLRAEVRSGSDWLAVS